MPLAECNLCILNKEYNQVHRYNMENDGAGSSSVLKIVMLQQA